MIKLVDPVTEFELSPTLQANEIVQQKRAAGETVLHMGFGESPFPVPDRLQQALAREAHHKEYLPTYGLPALCAAVKKYYKDRTAIPVDEYDVVITPGSKLALYALQMAIEGDLIMPVPSWVSYLPQARMLGQNVVKVPARLDDDGYHIDIGELASAVEGARKEGFNPRKLILNYPNNPTGLSIPDDEQEKLADFCRAEDILIISDEIYGFVNGENSYQSISQYLPEKTAITTGLSKHLSLGGWRLGVAFVPKEIEGFYQRICQIASELWSSVPAPIQYAAIEAYESHDDIEEHIAHCSAIHNLMGRYCARRLKAAGITCAMPQGAFYVYPDFAPYKEELAALGVKTSTELAAYLGEHYNVITLPGTAFGAAPEELTLRLSVCDYDGAAALHAAKNGAALDDGFISAFAPRLMAAADAFDTFAVGLTQGRDRVCRLDRCQK